MLGYSVRTLGNRKPRTYQTFPSWAGEPLLFHQADGSRGEEQEYTARKQREYRVPLINISHDPPMNNPVHDLRNRNEEIEHRATKILNQYFSVFMLLCVFIAV